MEAMKWLTLIHCSLLDLKVLLKHLALDTQLRFGNFLSLESSSLRSARSLRLWETFLDFLPCCRPTCFLRLVRRLIWIAPWVGRTSLLPSLITDTESLHTQVLLFKKLVEGQNLLFLLFHLVEVLVNLGYHRAHRCTFSDCCLFGMTCARYRLYLLLTGIVLILLGLAECLELL